MCDLIPPQIYDALKTVIKGDIEDFKIIVHDANRKGEGFMGEVVYVTLESKHSGQVLDFVVKQAFNDKRIRDEHPIRDVFVNEIYFYTRIWKSLDKFQEKIPGQYQFKKLPKYFTSISDDNSEKLVLENLKFQNFQVHDKKVPLSGDHYEVILKEYGKFHALSFAYKTLCPEDYARLVRGQIDIYSELLSTEGFQTALRFTVEMSIDNLQSEEDDAIREKLKPYLTDYLQYFQNSLSCNEKYSVITHGDCWSNNMMFKYDEAGKVSDVRFLDFQLSKEGSPCCDLSYCLYSGAPKEVLQDFDYYLKVYHNSLSATLEAFGCDPEEVYPFRAIKEEWKQYCNLGVMMGLMIWKFKCTYEDNILDLKDNLSEEEMDEAYRTGYDKDKYSAICRNLLRHLSEQKFL